MPKFLKKYQSATAKLKELKTYPFIQAVKVYPEGIKFQGQEATESIILFLRQHPIVLVRDVAGSLGLLLIFIFFACLFSQLGNISSINTTAITLVVMIMGVMFTIASLLYALIKWYFNVFIVTNTRVVDLDFTTIFDSRWSGATLSKIQDVSLSTPGFFATFFDMGNLFLQTSAEKSEFEILNIPKPHAIQDIILDLVENQRVSTNMNKDEQK